MDMKLKMKSFVVAMSLCVVLSMQATLRHRYDFTADANDVVGGLASALVADALVADGSLIVDDVGDYLELDAAGIAINTYTTDLTLELWSTQDTQNRGFSMTASFGGTWENGLGRTTLPSPQRGEMPFPGV